MAKLTLRFWRFTASNLPSSKEPYGGNPVCPNAATEENRHSAENTNRRFMGPPQRVGKSRSVRPVLSATASMVMVVHSVPLSDFSMRNG